MGARQKDITIPEDVVLKWISNYWANLDAAVRQIRDKNTNTETIELDGKLYRTITVVLDGTRYVIKVHTLDYTITLNLGGQSDMNEKYSDNTIKSMLDWIAPIVEYVKKASSGDEKH